MENNENERALIAKLLYQLSAFHYDLGNTSLRDRAINKAVVFVKKSIIPFSWR